MSSSPISRLSTGSFVHPFGRCRTVCWRVVPSGFPRQQYPKLEEGFGGGGCGRRLAVVEAKRGRKRNDQSDSHSAVPKIDEAIGPFPESVLLKKKSVQEDGRFLPEFADAEEEELFDSLSLQFESDLNVERVRHYEVVYLIHEDHVDDVQNVISNVQDFIRERKGRIWRLNDWGLRRLAYKIKKANKANYVLMNFELEAESINEFKTMLDKDERVIRHLVIKRDKAITEDCPPPLEFHTLQAGGVDDEDEDEDEDEGELDDEDDITVIDDGKGGNDGGLHLTSETASR